MLKGSDSVSRRQLIQTAVLAGFPTIVPSSVLGQRAGAVPPSDRIVLGGIGLGGRGTGDLRVFLGNKDVQFRAICDVRE